MTRKEEIRKASIDYQMSKMPMAIGGDAFTDMIESANVNPSFIAGAEWADKQFLLELRTILYTSNVNDRIYDLIQKYDGRDETV